MEDETEDTWGDLDAEYIPSPFEKKMEEIKAEKARRLKNKKARKKR